MKGMLAEADKETLVLIDEFGSGTEPTAGGAIAEAILGELDRRGVYAVITTHYTNLKLYAAAGDNGATNGAMLFDAQNIAPLFQLEMGLPGNSFAFELARKMGLPETIVRDAEDRAGEEFVGIERNLRQIARNRRVLDQKLQKVKVADRTLEGLTGKYQKELQDLQQQRKDILAEARKEAEEIIKGANKQVETTIRTIKEAQAEKSQTQEARKELQGFIAALEERKTRQQRERDAYIEGKLEQLGKRQEKEKARKARRADASMREAQDREAAETRRLEAFRTAPLKVGEKVRVKDNGMVGEVTKVSAKAVTLAVGNLSTKMPLDRVERISSNEFKAASKEATRPVQQREDPSITARKLNFRSELDVRGERLSDALDIVTHYIDDAMMLGMGSVRIIHGKGTGVLREEIQKYLRTIPGVSCHDEHIQFGGSGVTVVEFE
jgi:DNA mismatch repair protein MutS2